MCLGIKPDKEVEEEKRLKENQEKQDQVFDHDRKVIEVENLESQIKHPASARNSDKGGSNALTPRSNLNSHPSQRSAQTSRFTFDENAIIDRIDKSFESLVKEHTYPWII